jgi:hypothetical protein
MVWNLRKVVIVVGRLLDSKKPKTGSRNQTKVQVRGLSDNDNITTIESGPKWVWYHSSTLNLRMKPKAGLKFNTRRLIRFGFMTPNVAKVAVDWMFFMNKTMRWSCEFSHVFLFSSAALAASWLGSANLKTCVESWKVFALCFCPTTLC